MTACMHGRTCQDVAQLGGVLEAAVALDARPSHAVLLRQIRHLHTRPRMVLLMAVQPGSAQAASPSSWRLRQ